MATSSNVGNTLRRARWRWRRVELKQGSRRKTILPPQRPPRKIIVPPHRRLFVAWASRYCSASISRVASRMSFCADGLALLALERLAVDNASTNIACRFVGSFWRLAAANVLAA